MNNEDYNLSTLAWGVGIALVIVFTVIIIVNLPEMFQIVSEEGLLSQ